MTIKLGTPLSPNATLGHASRSGRTWQGKVLIALERLPGSKQSLVGIAMTTRRAIRSRIGPIRFR
jgi:hypothetical protein